MRRNICLFLITLFLIVFPVAAQQQTKPVRLTLIAGDLYEILDGRGSRGGVYIGDDSVLVIDSKMTKESVDQTIAAIKGITDLRIKYLVNTHSDGDHIAGNRFFPDSITFIAHENCRREFFHPQRNGNPSDWSKPELAPFLPTVTFSDKMSLYLGSKRIELWYFGKGHS
jgi:cyclase